MTKHFDGEEIHGRGELVVLILRAVQIGGDDEGIDKYESRFGGIVGVRHIVASFDTAQMGDLDEFRLQHVRLLGFLIFR